MTPEREKEIRDQLKRYELVENPDISLELLAEIDRLRAENLNLSEAHEAAQHYKRENELQFLKMVNYRQERDQLREELAVAIEALDHISNPEFKCHRCLSKDYPKDISLPRHYEDIALEALAKIRGEK